MNYDPQVILQTDYLPKFNEVCNLLSDTLERIEINKYMIYKIREYPIEDILSEYSVFISTIFYNSIEICILSFSKLLTDNSTDLICLNMFKKEVEKNIIDLNMKEEFNDEYQKIHKQTMVTNIKEKIRNIRNNLIAHHNMNIIDKDVKIDNISWNEFDLIITFLKRLIHFLTFGKSTLFVNTFSYHPEMNTDPRPENDFEKVVNLMEENSMFIHGIIKYDLSRETFIENHNKNEIEYVKGILLRKGIKNLI
jgi:hypothetical protein